MSTKCTHCGADIPESAIDRARDIATCGQCGSLVDVRPQIASFGESSAADSGGASAPQPRMRAAVALPAGMRITSGDGRMSIGSASEGSPVSISRRWLRKKHFVLLLVLGGLTAFAAMEWQKNGSSTALIIGSIFLGLWDLRLLSAFVNSTTIAVRNSQLTVRHGPIPLHGYKSATIPTERVRQLFARNWTDKFFEVAAVLDDGSRVTLVRPLVTEEQAIFVEQQLEKALGLVDYAVSGEVSSASKPNAVPAAVSKGAGGLLALAPIGIAAVGIFVFSGAFSSHVEGTLTATGEPFGEFTFEPDRCRSGETRGFYGVELTSEASPSTTVRLIRDPVDGVVVAVERGGTPPVSYRPADCTTLNINVNQTNTSVNEVWVVEGSATITCPALSGSVTYSGCH